MGGANAQRDRRLHPSPTPLISPPSVYCVAFCKLLSLDSNPCLLTWIRHNRSPPAWGSRLNTWPLQFPAAPRGCDEMVARKRNLCYPHFCFHSEMSLGLQWYWSLLLSNLEGCTHGMYLSQEPAWSSGYHPQCPGDSSAVSEPVTSWVTQLSLDVILQLWLKTQCCSHTSAETFACGCFLQYSYW